MYDNVGTVPEGNCDRREYRQSFLLKLVIKASDLIIGISKVCNVKLWNYPIFLIYGRLANGIISSRKKHSAICIHDPYLCIQILSDHLHIFLKVFNGKRRIIVIIRCVICCDHSRFPIQCLRFIFFRIANRNMLGKRTDDHEGKNTINHITD